MNIPVNSQSLIVLLLVILLFQSCKKDTANSLIVNQNKIEFQKDGGTIDLIIKTDANSWSIQNQASEWLNLSSTSGTEKTATVNMTVNTRTIQPRTSTIIINAGNANPVEVTVTQFSSEYLYSLSVDRSGLSFKRAGNTLTLVVNTDAPQWTLSTTADWLQFSTKSGTSGNTTINITAGENTETSAKTATININAENASTQQISVTQIGEIYPDYNTSPLPSDATGMSSTAIQLASKIKLGWNIGNTLEATGGETAWGNPKITKAYVDFVKHSGFNAVRLPCSWNQYMANTSTAQLKADWLNRVKEVVQYCVDDDMYVLLNIHWDGGWLENNCTEDKQEENNAKQKAFWEQIATQLRDFDEHLLFASANEPNVADAVQMAVLNSYHQTFINAVRATGGHNSYRTLVIQGPSTDIETTNKLMKTLPTDQASNRMMVEIHYYTPWNFTGMTKDETWGNQFYYWGNGNHSTTDTAHNPTWGEESTVDAYLNMMKTQFVDKGIPVIMGEYGCALRTNLTGDALTLHKASRAYYFKYVTKQAKARGILPFFWDTGGVLDRQNNTVLDQQALDALIQGSSN